MILFLKKRASSIKKRVTSTWQRLLDRLTGDLAPARWWVVLQILAAGVLVHLAAVCIEEVFNSLFARHWDALAFPLLGLFVLSPIAVLVGFRAYKGATSFRLTTHSREETPDIDVLILPV